MRQLRPATIITTTATLRNYVDDWADKALLAVDTESNSLHAYQEQVCLIQLSTRDQDFIIDPLMIENLDPLGELIADPAIETVFHAAEYDVMCLKRDFGFEFAGLFDTMLAARICGEDKLGLASMLTEQFGVKVNKKYQRANWGERPIPEEMLHYAQLDTHYLPELRDYWKHQLAAMGRWEEAREAFADLKHITPVEQSFNPEGYWRINGIHRLSPQQTAILRELYTFREKMAQQRDYPPFKIMSDKTLIELSMNHPAHTQDLRAIRGMTAGQIRRYGHGVLQAIRRGTNEQPPNRPPNPPRPSDEVVARFEALRNWRKKRAQMRGVESDVIVSRDALWALAHRSPSTVEEVARVRAMGPWRTQAYGEEIIAVIERINRNGHNDN